MISLDMNKAIKILLLLSITLISNQLLAQKFGYIDSEYVLNKHPDYKGVQQELEKLSNAWKKEAQDLDAEIKEMYIQLKAEEVLLTEEMYQKRMQEIQKKEKNFSGVQQSDIWNQRSVLPKASRTLATATVKNIRCHRAGFP